METLEARWDPGQIEESAATLTEFFANDAVHQRTMLEILDRHSTGPIGVDRSKRLLGAATVYAGEDVAGFFLGYLDIADQDSEFMEAIHDKVPADVADFLRRMLALYGAVITEAAVIEESLDSWRDFRREVYYDLISAEWRVRIEIERYRGDVLSLKETPTSTLVLAHATLDTLMAAIENAGVEAVDPLTVGPLHERVLAFLEATNEGRGSDRGFSPHPVVRRDKAHGVSRPRCCGDRQRTGVPGAGDNTPLGRGVGCDDDRCGEARVRHGIGGGSKWRGR